MEATMSRCMIEYCHRDSIRAEHLPKLKIRNDIYSNRAIKFKMTSPANATRLQMPVEWQKRKEKEDSPWRGEFGEHERLIKTKAALHSSISSPSYK